MLDKINTSSTPGEPDDAPRSGLSRRMLLGSSAALAGATVTTLVVAEPAAATPDKPEQLLKSLPSVHDIPRRSRIVDYEIAELIVLLRANKLTSVELTRAYLDRIDRLNGPFETYGDNGGYNAFVRVDRVGALAQAAAADKLLRKGSRTSAPPLCGIPFGIKDSVGVRGLEAKNGTHAYDGNVAYRDSTVVATAARAGRGDHRAHHRLGVLRLHLRHVRRQRLEPAASSRAGRARAPASPPSPGWRRPPSARRPAARS